MGQNPTTLTCERFTEAEILMKRIQKCCLFVVFGGHTCDQLFNSCHCANLCILKPLNPHVCLNAGWDVSGIITKQHAATAHLRRLPSAVRSLDGCLEGLNNPRWLDERVSLYLHNLYKQFCSFTFFLSVKFLCGMDRFVYQAFTRPLRLHRNG